MVATTCLALFTVFLQVVGNPIIDPPTVVGGGSSSSSNTTVNNTTNVYQTPSPEVIAAAESQAAPAILDGGLRGIDKSGAASMSEIFNLGLSIAHIRKDMILLPVVVDLNTAMKKIVALSLSMVLAALCIWGMISESIESDAHEAFECLMRVPLWCILALTSLSWYEKLLDFFAAIAAMITVSGNAAFGPTMREDFWSNTGLGLFALFVGIFYLLNLLLFAIQLFANTGFLAFCGFVAPVFVFLKTTPWTSRWGDNWFRMVPGTAGDILAMLAILTIGAAGMDRISDASAFATLSLDLGLLLALPLVRRLFGLENNSVGSRLFGAAMLWRTLRQIRNGQATTAAAKASSSTASTTTPTRAARWSNQYGNAATRRPTRIPAGSRVL